MPQHIDDAPEAVTAAGQDFDYVNPPRFAQLVLVNAPLDPDHVNIGLNRAAYDAFIDAELAATPDPTIPGGRAWTVPDLTVQSPEHDLQLAVEYETASTFYNYGRMTIGTRRWYIFYTPEYRTKEVTVFRADVDEVASYDWSLGYSTIKRGHVAVAASSAGDIGYCLEPEPFSPSELVGYSATQHDPLATAAVLVISTTDLTANPFKPVDSDVADTTAPAVTNTNTAGTISAPQPVGGPQDYSYTVGNAAYEDPFYYPYADAGELGGGNVIDTISPGHHITNPGGTVASGWQWHVDNADGRGGDDWSYDFEPFTAPAAGTVDHFTVAGVGMVTRLTLDVPAARTSEPQPEGDAAGPIYSIWFEHTSASIDGHHEQGDVIGTSGDGGGLYAPHLHVHALTDHSNVAGANNRACMWGFLDGSAGASVMQRPYVTGATPSLVDGIPAEGGVFVYDSVESFMTHMSKLAHTPWMVEGISRAILIPGGGAGTNAAIPLTPWDTIQDTSGTPVYHAEFVTSVSYDHELTADWTAELPAAYRTWTKLQTAPFAMIQLADRLGSVDNIDPQAIPSLGALSLHVEGAFHPTADVAVWISDASGVGAPDFPMTLHLEVDLPHYMVGRDVAYAGTAARISAERSQSIFEMLLAFQRASVDNVYTQSSAFTATQYAVAESA